MSTKRFGVSLDESVLKKLDKLISLKGLPNRSQAIRFLIEEQKIKTEEFDEEKIIAGAIVLVYDHHKRDIEKIANSIQHDLHHLILAVQHIHLDHHNCMESIAVKGKSKEIHQLANSLISLKGIQHGKLVIGTSD